MWIIRHHLHLVVVLYVYCLSRSSCRLLVWFFSHPRSRKYFYGTGSTIGEVQDLLFSLVFLWKTTTNQNKIVSRLIVGCYFLGRCCGCMKPGRNKCRQVTLPRSKWMDQRNADPLAPRTSSFLTPRSLFVPLCVSVYAQHHQQTSLSIGISLTTRIRSLSTCASRPSAVVGRRSVDFTSAAHRVRSDEGS